MISFNKVRDDGAIHLSASEPLTRPFHREQGGIEESMEITYSMISEDRPKRPRKYPGVRVIKDAIPADLIDSYIQKRWRILGGTRKWLSGWSSPTPYLHISSMRDIALAPNVMEALNEEMGEEMMLHLCLTRLSKHQAALAPGWLPEPSVRRRQIPRRVVCAR